MALLKLEPDVYVLAMTFHRLIADGWSLRVFLNELSLLWTAEGDARKAQLPQLHVHYADYAEWQNTVLASRPA